MNMKCNTLLRWTTLLIAPLLLHSLHGEASPSPRQDSTLQETTRKAEKPLHSPRKATYMAMALPGLGQLYNDHWWKLPVLYGGAGAAVYGFSWNNRQYTLYRDAFVEFTQYLNAKTEDPELPYPKVNGWDKLFKPG